uniref:Copia protein n=1 Tax=Tanacetum cinerariifolium TaxID=118510 RepID=A0A699ICC9_TANCI|nr:copia protein [Tanacetum cinerariifolium]
MIIKKDSKIVKAKGERRSLALKAKMESSDEECSTSKSEDEEYAMAVRELKKFFKRRGRCEDPNHLIGECPKPPKDKNQRAFVRSSWSDSSEKVDEKAKEETCLVAQTSSEVRYESSYFSDENPSIVRRSLENEISKLKEKVSTLEKNKRVDLECTKCQLLKIDNKKLKEKVFKLTQFEKSTHSLNEMLCNKKSSEDKSGLRFNSFEASSSGTKEIKFVKPENNTSFDEGPQSTEGGLHKGQTAPKLLRDRLSVHQMSINLVDLEPDEWIKDSECSKHMMGNQNLFSIYKAYNRGNFIFGSNLRANIIGKGRKWVYKNNLDENGVVSRNKARLESIRILLAYACALDFKLFQIDVKIAFLDGFNNEEVYVEQPSRFIDFKKPDHVYKLKKALYGLKEAPKAWYDRLKAFLIKNQYNMGMVDNTLFTQKKSSNLIVQIYVDDIIFGSTCQDMCDEFSKTMHDELEMSMMGELKFFLNC